MESNSKKEICKYWAGFLLCQNDMGMFNFLASSYSQLITVDSQGNQTILYDVNNTQMTKTIVAFFAVIVFAAVVVLMILVQFVKFRKR